MFYYRYFHILIAFVLFLSFLSCSSVQNNQRFIASSDVKSKYTIVIDIDWTIAYTVTNPNELTDVIKVGEHYYRVTDWTREIVKFLANQDDVDIVFFSGGDEVRNIELLKKIVYPSGETLYDIVGGKVFSRHHLLELLPGQSDDESIPFTKRFKKDLTVIRQNLKNLLLIDDDKSFILPTQSRSSAHLQNTYLFFENYEEVNKALEKKSNNKYIPTTKLEYELERNKLVWQFGLIMESIERDRVNGEGLAFNYQKLIKKRGGGTIPRNFFVQIEYMKKGFKRLGHDLWNVNNTTSIVKHFFAVPKCNRLFNRTLE